MSIKYGVEIELVASEAESGIKRLEQRIGDMYKKLNTPMKPSPIDAKEFIGSFKSSLDKLVQASNLAASDIGTNLSNHVYGKIAREASTMIKQLELVKDQVERRIGTHTFGKWQEQLDKLRQNAVGNSEKSQSFTMQGELNKYIARQKEIAQINKDRIAAAARADDLQNRANSAIMQNQLDRYTREKKQIADSNAAHVKMLAEKDRLMEKYHQAEMKRKQTEAKAVAAATTGATKSTGSGRVVGSHGDSGGWFDHYLRIAANYSIAYQVLRGVKEVLSEIGTIAVNSLKAYDELGETQAKMAMWANMVTKGQMSFNDAFKEGRANVIAFGKAATGSLSSIQDLTTSIDEFAQQGVIFGPDKMKDMVKFTDFVLMVAQTTGNSARQVRQEVQALFSGNIRPENQVLRTLKNFGVVTDSDLKGLKQGAINKEFVEKVISSVSNAMDPLYDKIFGASATRSFQRFYNTVTNGYVMMIEEVSRQQGSLNVFADAINKAKAAWDDWTTGREADGSRAEMVRNIALAFEDLVLVVTKVMQGVELLVSAIAKAINAVGYLWRIAASHSEAQAFDIGNAIAGTGGADDEDRDPEEVARQARIIRAQRIAAAGRLNGYDLSKYDGNDMVARMNRASGLSAIGERKPEEDKKAAILADKFKHLKEELASAALAYQDPLDKVGQAAEKNREKIIKLMDEYKRAGKSAKFQELWDAFGQVTDEGYKKQTADYSRMLEEAVLNGSEVSRKEIDKILRYIDDARSGISREMGPGSAKDSRLSEVDRLAMLTGQVSSNNSDLAGRRLMAFTNPDKAAYIEKEFEVRKKFEDMRKLDTDNRYKDEIDAEEKYQKERLRIIEEGGANAAAIGAKEGMVQYAKEMGNSFEQAQKTVQNAMKGIEDSIVNTFLTGKLEAGKFFQTIYEGIVRIFVQQMIMKPITAMGGSILDSLGTSLGFKAMTRHTGDSSVGSTFGSTRMVNPAIFNIAPRLHTGLRGDEFPAILQHGETVQPKGYRGETTVVIENHSAEKITPLQEKNGGNGMRELRVVIGQTMKELIASGAVDTSMQQVYGVRRIGR